MAYTTIDDPTDYFNTVLYTGNNNTNAIAGVGHQPDMIWVKKRNAEADHIIFDSVRGVTKGIFPSRNSAEETEGGNRGLRSFNTDGFTLGPEVSDMAGSCNDNNDTFAAWNWKAGTAFTNDASSTSIGSIDSAGSVNNDAGFSIVTYTGNDSVATVKHGLSSAPKMMIIKDRTADTTNDWLVYHDVLGNTKSIKLNLTGATGTDAAAWDNTSPTNSVFTIGRNGNINGDGNTIVAYCFAEKQGYSKFGSYIGNNNDNGAFIYTGFKPAWVMIKITDTQTDGWVMEDNKRNPINLAASARLRANTNAAEFSSTNEIDLLSNGFKVKGDDGEINGNDTFYLYMAFAENPFVTSTGIPTTAR